MENKTDQTYFALNAPIIAYPGGWSAEITQEQKDRVIVERLKNTENTATDYEAMLYLMTASLTAPLDDDDAQVYLYLVKKTHPNSGIDFAPDTLNGDQQRALTELKLKIRETQEKQMKERAREERRRKNGPI